MGASYDFPGSSLNTDYVDCGSGSSLDDLPTSNGLTVMAWLYMDGYTNSHNTIIRKSNNYSDGWVLYASNQGTTPDYRLRVDFSGGFRRFETPDNSQNSGQWEHIACVYDGSSDATAAVMYIDGVSQSVTTAENNSGTYDTDAAYSLRIGAGPSAGNNDFNGRIAYVQIWDDLLTAEEVNEAMWKPGSITKNLVGYWPFTDTDGSPADNSGQGNNGTITGSVAADNDGPSVFFPNLNMMV